MKVTWFNLLQAAGFELIVCLFLLNDYILQIDNMV